MIIFREGFTPKVGESEPISVQIGKLKFKGTLGVFQNKYVMAPPFYYASFKSSKGSSIWAKKIIAVNAPDTWSFGKGVKESVMKFVSCKDDEMVRILGVLAAIDSLTDAGIADFYSPSFIWCKKGRIEIKQNPTILADTIAKLNSAGIQIAGNGGNIALIYY